MTRLTLVAELSAVSFEQDRDDFTIGKPFKCLIFLHLEMLFCFGLFHTFILNIFFLYFVFCLIRK